MKSVLIWSLMGMVAAVATEGCNTAERQESVKAKPLVYEGMPASEMVKVLGEPDSVAAGTSVYDVAASRQKAVERWFYPKRTVVLIDDTVKVTNTR